MEKYSFRTFLIILIFNINNNAFADCPNPNLCNFEHISSVLGVQDIEQIDDILYLATTGGLVKYNLNTQVSVHFTTNNGLRNNVVRALASDSRGVLWIATDDGLCRLEDDCFFYESQPDNESPYRSGIDYLLVDNTDRLWLSEDVWSGCRLQWYDEINNTSDIIYQCDGDRDTPEVIPEGIKLGIDGKIWLLADSVDADGHVDRRLTYFDPNTLHQTIVTDTLPGDDYRFGFQVSNSGNIWLSDEGNMYRYNISTASFEFVNEASSNWVKNFVVLQNDIGSEDVWFVSPYQDGLFLNDQSNPVELNGALASNVFTLDDYVISATNQGLIRSLNSQMPEEFIPLPQEYRENRITQMTTDGIGNAWIAYRDVEEYPLMKYNIASASAEYYEVNNHNRIDHVSAVNDRVLVHNRQNLYRLNTNNIFELIEPAPPNVNYSYTSNILIDGQIIYIGIETESQTFHLLKIDNGTGELLGQTTERIKKIDFDNQGNIYIVTSEGLYLYDGNTVANLIPDITIADAGFNPVQNKLYLIRWDVQWFENRLYTYSAVDGLEEAVYSTIDPSYIHINMQGDIWLAGGTVQSTDGQGNLAGPFSVTDGLPTQRISCIHADNEGNVFIGSQGGMAVFSERDFISTSATNICPGETVSFSTSLQSDFEWQIIRYNEVLDTIYDAAFDYTFDDASNYIVKLNTIIDGCTQTDVQRIWVNPLATEVWLPESHPLCSTTDSVRLSTGIGMQSYLWTYDDETISESSWFYAFLPGEYTLFIEDFCGNTATLTTLVEAVLDVNINTDCDENLNIATLSTSLQYEDNAQHLWSTGETTPTIEVTEGGIYSVEVTFNGCTVEESIDITLPCFVSIDETHLNHINVFPNPSNGVFQIESDYTIEKLEVINIQGASLFTTNVNTINLSNLSAGIYFLKMEIDGNILMKKLIKS